MNNDIVYVCVYDKNTDIKTVSKFASNAIADIMKSVSTDSSDVTLYSVSVPTRKILTKQKLSSYWADNRRKQNNFQLNGEAAEMFNTQMSEND